MNLPRLSARSSLLRLPAKFIFCAALILPVISAAQVETGQWNTKTGGARAALAANFPTPTLVSGSAELLVVPLLGPQRTLLPGGKLLVWVGRNDGTPLANAGVTIRVPSPGNALVSGGGRVTEITLQTNSDGIAEFLLTAPNIPPGSGGSGGGGDGGGGGGNGGGDDQPPASE